MSDRRLLKKSARPSQLILSWTSSKPQCIDGLLLWPLNRNVKLPAQPCESSDLKQGCCFGGGHQARCGYDVVRLVVCWFIGGFDKLTQNAKFRLVKVELV